MGNAVIRVKNDFCVPGLSPLTFSDKAIKKIKNRNSKIQSWFLDQTLVLDYWSGQGKRSAQFFLQT